MDWSVVGPTAGVAITAIAGIVVERIRARAATKKEIAAAVEEAVDKKVAAFEKRVAEIEALEDADKVKLLTDVERMGRELAALRAEHDQRWAGEETRRARAAERLERKDREENERYVERERKLAELTANVQNLLEVVRARRR